MTPDPLLDANPVASPDAAAGPPGSAGPAPAGGDDVVLVRHEERAVTATQTVAVEKVVVRRRVVTETRTVEVTVRREELEVVRETLPTDAPRGGAAGEGSGERGAFVVVLSQEEPVVTLRTVPYERVRVSVVPVTGQQVVPTVLRREQIDLEPGSGSARQTARRDPV